jgi:type IV secretion system protein VirD4
MPALGWLTSPAASAAASGEHPFVVEELLDSSATVYLLGAEETQAAPLVCALTGYVAREARRLAAARRSGRLDPPLTLALDEAALISPVPLQSWTADMGGRGVTIIGAFQSRAQVIARWGETGAAIILNNAAAVMVFGGTRDRDDLAFWSTLAGERDEPVATTDVQGRAFSKTVRKVPVLAPAQIANLPAGHAVVYRRGIPPVVGRVRMAWRRRDIRAHGRAIRVEQRNRRLQVRRDAVVEAVLDVLAARWPSRFAELARRVHDRSATRRDEVQSPEIEAPPNVIPLRGRRP